MFEGIKFLGEFFVDQYFGWTLNWIEDIITTTILNSVQDLDYDLIFIILLKQQKSISVIT